MSNHVSSGLLPILKPADYTWLTDDKTFVSGDLKRHPRPYRLRLVAEQFRKFAKIETNKVDFSGGYVPSVRMTKKKMSSCNTVACHGGWLMPALYNIGVAEVKEIMDGDTTTSKGYLDQVSFSSGCKQISRYLFNRYFDENIKLFHYWAESNPDLWGGHDGDAMFLSNGHRAFLLPEYSSRRKLVTLNAIADRYDDVAYNIEQEFYK